MKIEVISGDITQVECDAIITLINSNGAWFGGVDSAIMRVAGRAYHAQVGRAMHDDLINLLVALNRQGEPKKLPGLLDGDVIVAPGNKEHHNGQFDNVIFVIDDLEIPVGQLLSVALETAKKCGYKHVALPALRTGVMLGAHPDEPDLKTTILALISALKNFQSANELLDLTVTFVIYNDPEVQGLIEKVIND